MRVSVNLTAIIDRLLEITIPGNQDKVNEQSRSGRKTNLRIPALVVIAQILEVKEELDNPDHADPPASGKKLDFSAVFHDCFS